MCVSIALQKRYNIFAGSGDRCLPRRSHARTSSLIFDSLYGDPTLADDENQLGRLVDHNYLRQRLLCMYTECRHASPAPTTTSFGFAIHFSQKLDGICGCQISTYTHNIVSDFRQPKCDGFVI